MAVRSAWVESRGLVTTIALACLLAPLAISTETVAAGTTSTGSDDGGRTEDHATTPGHRTHQHRRSPCSRAAAVTPGAEPCAGCSTRPADRRTHRHRLQALPRPGPGPAQPRHDRRGRGRTGYATTGSRSYYLTVRPADPPPPAAPRRPPGHRHVRANPLPAATDLHGNHPAVGRCGRQLGATTDLYGTASPPMTSPRCSTGSDRSRRPLRRLLRHVLHPGVRRPSSRMAPDPGARRGVLRRRRRPVVLRHQPCSPRTRSGGLRAQPLVRETVTGPRCTGWLAWPNGSATNPSRPGTERGRVVRRVRVDVGKLITS